MVVDANGDCQFWGIAGHACESSTHVHVLGRPVRQNVEGCHQTRTRAIHLSLVDDLISQSVRSDSSGFPSGRLRHTDLRRFPSPSNSIRIEELASLGPSDLEPEKSTKSHYGFA